MRRTLASLFTLSLLFSFLLAVVVGLMVFFGELSLGVAVVIVILFNGVMLLVSPYINDFIYRFFYDMTWVSLEELETRSPESAAVVREVTEEYDYSTPKLGVVHDSNPTAFTYGSGRFNARIFVSEGLFEYLDDEEVASVVAHELGHVTSRDFITMTLANTIVQILYLVAIRLIRIGLQARNIKDPKALLGIFGVVTLIFYFISEYAVLYLSRVREYAADEFAAEYTDPDAMSLALVKVAYGILETKDNSDLAKSTKNIGLMAVRESQTDGMMYKSSQEQGRRELLERSFLFDLKNPWATLLELKSTHPLTGKRIRALSAMEGATEFDFDAIERDYPIDKRRMRRKFLRELTIFKLSLYLGALVAVGYVLAAVFGPIQLTILGAIGIFVVMLGVGAVLKTMYAFPSPDGDDDTSTLLEQMANPYASPVAGTYIDLTGEIIGKVPAGRRFARHVMLQDRTGLVPLIYRSRLPLIGDLLWAWKTVPGLIGKQATATGWFYRGMGPRVALDTLETPEDVHNAGHKLFSLLKAAVFLTIGGVLLYVGFVLGLF